MYSEEEAVLFGGHLGDRVFSNHMYTVHVPTMVSEMTNLLQLLYVYVLCSTCMHKMLFGL